MIFVFSAVVQNDTIFFYLNSVFSLGLILFLFRLDILSAFGELEILHAPKCMPFWDRNYGN